MIKGLYTSAMGMTTQMRKMDVITNNIANVNTNAYKTDEVITQSFTEEFLKHMDSAKGRVSGKNAMNLGAMSNGLFVDNIHTDFSIGSYKTTEGPLDIAIAGDGFFAVNYVDKNGNSKEVYTRDGAFSLSSEGHILTKDGYRVQGSEGDIVLPHGEISINSNGEIYVDSQLITSFKIVDFDDKSKLRKHGSNFYRNTDGNIVDFKGTIEQGLLEMSNVNSVEQMVELINISRTYEANQRMIQTHDQTLSKAVNEIANR